MKHIYIILSILLIVSCSSFLDINPQGTLEGGTLENETGINSLLVGTYSRLHSGGYNGLQNWVYGSVMSDDSYKGSELGDQVDLNDIERYKTVANNGYPKEKWNACYGNISAANRVLQVINRSNLSQDFKKQVTGEARFLRALNYFELKKIFNKPSWLDENDIENSKPIKTNDVDIWPYIAADFKYAMNNLQETPSEVGRAYKWAAVAFLAKTYIFQSKYDSAKIYLDQLVTIGKNAKGQKYDLVDNFYDIYNIETKNGIESVFALQCSVFDGANGAHGNLAMRLNYPYGSTVPGGCCGFYQPTYNLVNSYKVDEKGLPLFDTYNKENLKNDQGVASSAPFSPDITTPLDPRLDWTVGRRGIPYLDWGVCEGQNWVRSQVYGGPYLPKKNMYYKSQFDAYVEYDWSPRTAMNYEIIRFADVLLWAAECEVEVGSLEKAREYVNRVRERAGKDGNKIYHNNGTIAANYKVGLYPEGAFNDKEYARTAVRFERRLELAMEGHRFFDLVRWGIADKVLNTFLEQEQYRQGYFQGCSFEKNKSEYMPIPEEAIRQTMVGGKATLKQNPGY